MIRMLRVILVIGNFILLMYIGFLSGFKGQSSWPYISVHILLILNIFFLAGEPNTIDAQKSNQISFKELENKRKRIEEEIKIQEAENKLRELKDKK